MRILEPTRRPTNRRLLDRLMSARENPRPQPTRQQERFTFLVDTSGSMSEGGVETSFSEIYGEFLDALAEGHPNALVRLVTFNDAPHPQYDFTPIESAPSLNMNARGNTEFPMALMEGVGIQGLGTGDTVIIITDGDLDMDLQFHDPSMPYYYATDCWLAIRKAKERGVKFLLLVANMTREEACGQARKISVDPSEVRVWGHSEAGLRKTLREASDLLTLGAVPS